MNKFVIVDLEATCWESGSPPFGQAQEIIEYGICEIDKRSLEILDNYSILVKPNLSTVSDFCTRLTGHTQDNLDRNGLTSKEAYDILINKYYNVDWGSYGMFDKNLINQTYSYRMPFGRNHVNIKNLVALAFGKSREFSMTKALNLCNLKLEGTHHSGKDDAYNIAKIWIYLIRKMRS